MKVGGRCVGWYPKEGWGELEVDLIKTYCIHV